MKSNDLADKLEELVEGEVKVCQGWRKADDNPPTQPTKDEMGNINKNFMPVKAELLARLDKIYEIAIKKAEDVNQERFAIADLLNVALETCKEQNILTYM